MFATARQHQRRVLSAAGDAPASPLRVHTLQNALMSEQSALLLGTPQVFPLESTLTEPGVHGMQPSRAAFGTCECARFRSVKDAHKA